MAKRPVAAPAVPVDGLRVEYRPVADLVPYARNARTHSLAQVGKIAASIREFGFTNPLLIDADGGIIAGHGRALAAREAGLQTVPCIVLSHLTDAQKRGLVLADNRLALSAGWDDDLLRAELTELKALDFDLGLTGFDPAELDGLFADGADLMDPMDGGDQTAGAGRKLLQWGGKKVALDDDEIEMLNKALSDYVKANGVYFGFVRSILGSV